MSFVYSTADTLQRNSLPLYLHLLKCWSKTQDFFVPYLLCALFCGCLIKDLPTLVTSVTGTAVDALSEKKAIISCQPRLQAMGELSIIRFARSCCSSCSTVNEPLQLDSNNVSPVRVCVVWLVLYKQNKAELSSFFFTNFFPSVF